MARLFIALLSGTGMTVFSSVAMAGFSEELSEKILSQCGLATAILVAGIVWLAMQNAKTRQAWETDRSELIKIIVNQNSSNQNLTVAKEKLETLLLAVESRRR